MNRIVTLFRKHTRNFSGKISIAAHSLGGVICFDLLANQESVSGGAWSRGAGRRSGYTSFTACPPSSSYPLRLSALLRMPCCMVMLLQVVDLAEVRARERGAAQDPRRQHLKYGYTSYPKLQFNVVNMFG